MMFRSLNFFCSRIIESEGRYKESRFAARVELIIKQTKPL